ncbi:hypothetical protein Q7P36_002327 [Cladosporium allicinum]
MSSSPLRPGASRDEELEYYKRQYEQLETDLADYQASSKELEDQLEKDVDAAEKNERKLREQVEKLNFEVDEWKGKHKQAKAEANSAQNTLQKEITTIREQHRGLTLKLRDIEVANDDYERQARNTSSSMDDLESKLNVAIERGVLMEEEIRIGEQEREGLRIEAQRLRDELGDLKVEHDIRLEKLRRAEATIESLRSGKPSTLAVKSLRTRSPASEISTATPTSPTTSTPPTKSETTSDVRTPPSPPLSDAPAHVKIDPHMLPPAKRSTSLMPDAAATLRTALPGSRAVSARHTRVPSIISGTSSAAPSEVRSLKTPILRSSQGAMARSESLYQMKSLRNRMQKIEERVHNARSKLPPPNNTPKSSPRAVVPSSVTLRRSSKRPSAINTSTPSYSGSEDAGGPPTISRHNSHIKRLSYGIPRPSSSMATDRPPPVVNFNRPLSRAGNTRPESRISSTRPESRISSTRPESRISSARPESHSGADTPLGGNFRDIAPPSTSTIARPRSSISGPSYNTLHSSAGNASPRKKSLHRSSQSISEHTRQQPPEGEEPSRRTSGLPAPAQHARRQSVQMRAPPSLAPRPPSRKAVEAQEQDLGETY